eukprot:s435_g2.t1
MGYGFRTMDDLDLAVDDASRAMSLTFEKCPGDVLHLALPEEKVDFRGTDAQAENLQALWEARLREEREAGLKACCEKLRGPLTTGVLEAILATICIFMEDPVRYKFLNIVQPVVVCMQMFPGNPRIQVPSCQILLSLTSNGSLSNEHEEAIQKFSKCCGISPLVQAMKDLPCHLSNEALRVGCSQDFSSTFLQLSLMFWPWAAGDQPSKGLLRLHVHCDSTRPGEDLGVCGDAPLPGWRGVKPLSMICQDPVTGETYWPVWKLAEPLEVSVGQELHYKYLLIRGTRRDKFKWEADGIGNHRRLRVTEEMLRAGSWDDGLFGDLPGGCPRPKKKRDEREDREAKQERKEDEEDEMCEVPKALSLPKHERIRQVGKGKQGACFLVDLDGEKAVLKAFGSSGSRLAARAAFFTETGSELSLKPRRGENTRNMSSRKGGGNWPEPRTSQEHREFEALRMIQALALDLPRPRRRINPIHATMERRTTEESDRVSDRSLVHREGSERSTDRESERVEGTAKGQN